MKELLLYCKLPSFLRLSRKIWPVDHAEYAIIHFIRCPILPAWVFKHFTGLPQVCKSHTAQASWYIVLWIYLFIKNVQTRLKDVWKDSRGIGLNFIVIPPILCSNVYHCWIKSIRNSAYRQKCGIRIAGHSDWVRMSKTAVSCREAVILLQMIVCCSFSFINRDYVSVGW